MVVDLFYVWWVPLALGVLAFILSELCAPRKPKVEAPPTPVDPDDENPWRLT